MVMVMSRIRGQPVCDVYFIKSKLSRQYTKALGGGRYGFISLQFFIVRVI